MILKKSYDIGRVVCGDKWMRRYFINAKTFIFKG
jgi:hypothetical protein